MAGKDDGAGQREERMGKEAGLGQMVPGEWPDSLAECIVINVEVCSDFYIAILKTRATCYTTYFEN